ncbi:MULTISPECIES: hypothetical protein [unclassified Paraflavitalea]
MAFNPEGVALSYDSNKTIVQWYSTLEMFKIEFDEKQLFDFTTLG